MKAHLLRVSLLLSTLMQGLLGAVPSLDGSSLRITPDLIARLTDEARSHSPAIGAADARADAASAAVDAVRNWDDPIVSLGLWIPSSHSFPSSDQGNIIYGLEQRLPLFGRPKLARDVAEADAAKERLNVESATLGMRHDLTVALLGIAMADEALSRARQDLGWIDQTVLAVDGRYRVGRSTQVEWLKVQTERAKAGNDLISLEQERGSRVVQLNRVLNRDLHSPWPRIELPGIADEVPYDDRLVAAALGFAPKLKVMRQEAAQTDAAARLTRSQRLPDIGIGLEARQYSNDGGIREGTMTVNFSVPWLNHKGYDSDLRRDIARKRASEREADDYELGVREEIHHMTVDLDAARRQAVLYRDEIIPLAEQTLASARTAWENNLGTFQDILETHRMLVEDRLVLAKAITLQASGIADLTLLTGLTDYKNQGEGAQSAQQ
jgi:cobalt-zinc-cadmium efflux system outer membrane protein